MKMIDGRAFVPYGAITQTAFYQNVAKRRQIAEEKYNTSLPASMLEQSMAKYLQEMDELDIVKALVPARLAAEKVDNDVINALLQQYPNRFIGFAAVEGSDSQAALETIKQYVLQGPCQGVVMEPGCEQEKIAIHDERLYPIYQMCQDHHIPLLVGFGGMLYPTLKLYKPDYLEDVVKTFPQLSICIMHGGWPYVAEMIWLALMNSNLYIMPDLYMSGTPFCETYAQAANTVIKDNIIFGSCYPVISQKAAVQFHKDSGLHEEAFDKVFYKNVCRFCGIEETL